MKIVFGKDARADVRSAADWFIDRGAGQAAASLRQEIGRTLARLAAEPGLGTPGPAGTRILPVHRFPVSLVYRVEGQVLRIVAVAAQRRRPGYWAHRR